jgi:hypothetical protein
VTSLKELPQNHLVILLASRFNLNQGGHFYWYTKEIVAELNDHHPNYLVLSPPIKDDKTPDFIDDRWHFIEDFQAWGNDLGTMSPRKLIKRILPILKNLDEAENITIFSFESSFSMVVALLEIQRKIPNLRVSVTLLDHGFWKKFLSTRIPFIRFLVLNFIGVLRNANSSFKLLHPSLSQLENFSRLLGIKVSPYSHISAFWKFSEWPLKIDPKELRLLVLPWSVDLDHVKEFVNSASSKIGLDFKIHVHFKNQNDLNYFRESLEVDLFNRIEYSVGALSLEDYISQFKRSDLAWLPYTDFYHQITGSGRAFDCLALGCPLIIDERSDLALMVADFPLIYLCPDSDIHWISKFMEQLSQEKKDFDSYVKRRETLENLGSALFSPSNGIDSFLEPFDSGVKQGKAVFRFTDLLALETLYYFGSCYSKLKLP